MTSSIKKIWIQLILRHMYDYQRINNITSRCVDNVVFLYRSLVHNNINATVKAVFGVCHTDEIIYKGHLVIVLDDKQIIEPSYELKAHDIKYYYTLHDMCKKISLSDEDKRDCLVEMLLFTKTAEHINNDEGCLTNEDYAIKQSEYVYSKMLYD